MFKILAPTDFSPNAKIAMQYACDFVKDNQGKITLYHSFDPNQTEQSEVDDKMNALVENLSASYPNIDFAVEIERGAVVEAIRSFAQKGVYDFIVMGFKGASDDSDKQMGSVTTEVIRNVKLSVLAVPENAEYSPIKKIVYALDFEELDKDSIESLNQFSDQLGSEIVLLHVSQGGYMEEGKLQTFRKTMDEVINYENLTFEFVEGDDVSDAIEKFVKENTVNLLAMLTHDYHLIEQAYDRSFTRKMLFHCDIPLLVFHQ